MKLKNLKLRKDSLTIFFSFHTFVPSSEFALSSIQAIWLLYWNSICPLTGGHSCIKVQALVSIWSNALSNLEINLGLEWVNDHHNAPGAFEKVHLRARYLPLSSLTLIDTFLL